MLPDRASFHTVPVVQAACLHRLPGTDSQVWERQAKRVAGHTASNGEAIHQGHGVEGHGARVSDVD